ncbi:MAG: hypothetical protein ACE14V_06565 [bacterium]
MLIGTVDLLEFWMFIFTGSLLVTIGAMVDKSRYRQLLLWSLIMIVFGAVAMSTLSGYGGFDGRSEHPLWWRLFVLPYPIGWIMAIVGIIFRFIEIFRKPKEIDSVTN